MASIIPLEDKGPSGTGKRFYVTLNEEGTFVGAKARGTFRIKQFETLIVDLPAGSYLAQQDVVLQVTDGAGDCSSHRFERNELGGGTCVWRPQVSGSAELFVTCWKFGATEEDGLQAKLTGATNVIVVESQLYSNGVPIDTESSTLLTVISTCLGPLEEWVERLTSACGFAQYGALHFTPIQVIGDSGSCYSLADQREVNRCFTDKPGEAGWQEVRRVIDELENRFGTICLTDLVLNHTATNTKWLPEHPECGYNECNSPHLVGPIELDSKIQEFSKRLARREFEQRYGVGPHLSEANLPNLVDAFVNECLNPFKLHEWFTLNAESCVETYLEIGAGDTVRDPVDHGFQEALRLIGTSRSGVVLSDEVICQLAPNVETFRQVLREVQKKLFEESHSVYQSIKLAVESTVRWERIVSQKGPVTEDHWNGVLARYFTPVDGLDGKKYHLANNGWVMNWKAERDFAEPGTLIYFKRGLVCWQDCVKLRYGAEPEDCPFLWNLMATYCRFAAKTFHGVRLDNCHSTPPHVGKFMLQEARKIRPTLFVFAELFTGSEELDIKFENTLGLDALVREALQTSSPTDLANYAMRHGGRPLGALPQQRVVERFDCEPLIPRRAAVLFYDCTHDNPTMFQKGRPDDALCNAAFVAASMTMGASTWGYDYFVKQNPSVVEERRLYCTTSILPKDIREIDLKAPEKEKEEEAEIEIIWEGPVKSQAELKGSFNDWGPGIPMNQGVDGHWRAMLKRSANANGNKKWSELQFKFVIDGQWLISEKYNVTADASGNCNNCLRPMGGLIGGSRSQYPGMLEARRILNSVHRDMAKDKCWYRYMEMLDPDLALIMRHSSDKCKAYYFIIRSAWCTNWNDFPNRQHIKLSGRINGHLLNCRCRIPREAYENFKENPDSVMGLGNFGAAIYELPRQKEWYDPDAGETTLLLGAFPPGSVLIVSTQLEPIEERMQQLFEPMAETLKTISLVDMNYILFSCEREELDCSSGRRTVYEVPGSIRPVFAGFAGILPILNAARQANDMNHPYCDNTRKGDWLLEYYLQRMQDLQPIAQSKFCRIFKECSDLVKQNKNRWLSPRLIDTLLSKTYGLFRREILRRMPTFISRTNDGLVEDLAFATIQFYGRVKSAPLISGTDHPSVCAGLPHFSVEYMRCWGRDTFVALAGLLLATSRYEEARAEILGYARVVRHGLIPNLLDGGSHPRYNARDATWFFLQAVKEYVLEAPDGVSLMQEKVVPITGHGLPFHAPKVETMSSLIHHILSVHAHGVDFREWNAGERIDMHMKDEGFNIHIHRDHRYGFLVGGNRFNCGTWMDKMGSSDKAGNRGLPATPRDGAPVELVALLRSVLHFVVHSVSANIFPYKYAENPDGSEGISYENWLHQIDESFDKQFFINKFEAEDAKCFAVPGIYRDVWGCSVQEDEYALRCNFCTALAIAPKIADPKHAASALAQVEKSLFCDPNQLGLKTLDPRHPKYRPDYDNSNDGYDASVAQGYNYHNGPEWVWPLGHFLEARLYFGESSERLSAAIYNTMKFLTNHRRHLEKDVWLSLPEVTNRDGRVCYFSCPSQAWSVATILRFLQKAITLSHTFGAKWDMPIVSKRGLTTTFTRSFSMSLERKGSRIGFKAIRVTDASKKADVEASRDTGITVS